MKKIKNNILANKLNNRIIGLVAYLVVVVCTVVFLMQLIDGNKNYLFGYTARIVVSGSMEPEIKVNSLTIIKKCDIQNIKKNDIVCFNYSQDIIHRVVEKTKNDNGELVIHTKGDANKMPDSIEINSDMVVGKVVKTFNNVAPIIDKYSITPGQFDMIAFMRSIIIYGLILGVIIFIVSWFISIIFSIIKSFKKKDNLRKELDTYIEDIDDLMIYMELIDEMLAIKKDKQINLDEKQINSEDKQINSDEKQINLEEEQIKLNITHKISNKIRVKIPSIQYIGNKLARAKIELELKAFHNEIKGFKRSIKHSLYINKVCELLEENISKDKYTEKTDNILNNKATDTDIDIDESKN